MKKVCVCGGEPVNLDGPGFQRLETVLSRIIPVSRSAWYDGVLACVYPAPVSLGLGRAKGYRNSDLKKLVERLSGESDHG